MQLAARILLITLSWPGLVAHAATVVDGADAAGLRDLLPGGVILLLVLGLVLLAYRSHRAQGRLRAEVQALQARLNAQTQGQTQAQAQQSAQLERAEALRRERAARTEGDMLGATRIVADAARLLRATELTPLLRAQVERIDTGVHRLRATLSLLAETAQLEASTLALKPAPFDLDALLRDFGEAVAAQAAGTAREVVIDLEPDVPQVICGDAPRLMHLMQAMVDPALGPDGGGGVEDFCIHIGPDQPLIGLPALAPGAPLLLRFEFSAGNRTAPRELRCEMAEQLHARLLELMDGKAGLREAPGQGHVAWFTALVHVAEDVSDGGDGPSLSGLRVLVVDDNERARTMLATLLSHWGLSVTTVASGYAAISAASSAEISGPGFDLVMLDADMPELSGLETARLLGTQGLRELPARVLMTAAPAGPLLAQAQALGVAEVLRKPLSRLAVREMLRQLPLRSNKPLAAKPGPRVQAEAGLPLELQALNGARVLLVEDNEINQQIALELLQAAGMAVQLAVHGQAAVELLNWQYFDLVLMDVEMPVLDGLAATRLIRADRRHTTLPIVAMTAAGRLLDRQRCLEVGMNAHLIKPFDLDSLWAVLQRWITPRPGLGLQGPELGGPAAAVPPAPDALKMPASMPGIDVQRALHRMGGRVDLYLRTARMFADTQADTANQIRVALDSGDRETAIRMSTTLKNLAGNLGAEHLQNEALSLEACLREGAEGSFKGRVEHLQDALEVVCFAIRSMLISSLAKPVRVAGVSAADSEV